MLGVPYRHTQVEDSSEFEQRIYPTRDLFIECRRLRAAERHKLEVLSTGWSRRDYRVHVLLGFAMLPIAGLSQLSAHLMGSSHREFFGSSPFGADTVVGFFAFVISVFCACTSFFVMRGALTFIRQSLGTPFSTLRATCKVALLGLVLSQRAAGYTAGTVYEQSPRRSHVRRCFHTSSRVLRPAGCGASPNLLHRGRAAVRPWCRCNPSIHFCGDGRARWQHHFC